MTASNGLTFCPSCKGEGRIYRSWLKHYVICVRCGGLGQIAPRDESYRDFRKRVIEGK